MLLILAIILFIISICISSFTMKLQRTALGIVRLFSNEEKINFPAGFQFEILPEWFTALRVIKSITTMSFIVILFVEKNFLLLIVFLAINILISSIVTLPIPTYKKCIGIIKKYSTIKSVKNLDNTLVNLSNKIKIYEQKYINKAFNRSELNNLDLINYSGVDFIKINKNK